MVAKRCTLCQQTLPLSEFRLVRGGKYRDSWCRVCHRSGRKSERIAQRRALLRDGQRQCSRCQLVLPISAFRPKEGGKYYSGWCRPCAQAVQNAWKRTAHGKATSKAALQRRIANDPTLVDRLRANRRADYHRHREARLATSAANPRRHWYARNSRLKQKYGLDHQRFETLAAAQGHRCAICDGGPTTRRPILVVDHDHATGAVRGLLCAHCNTGLGNFRDSVDRLHAAIAYLQRGDRIERLPVEDRPNDGQHNKLKRFFGIGRTQYELLCARQQGRCALCQQVPQQRRRLAVDHDHATDTIRGILCGTCNAGLGHFKDDVTKLAAAVTYLRRFQSDEQVA